MASAVTKSPRMELLDHARAGAGFLASNFESGLASDLPAGIRADPEPRTRGRLIACAMGVFSQVYEYFRLLRVYNHGNFVVVLAGAAFFDRVASLADILMLYLSFNIFLYGGIYTMNAVTDYESDRANPAKRGRPIASGAISVAAGSVFMLLSWAFAFASSYFYFGSTKFFVYYAGFLAVNVAYSFYFKVSSLSCAQQVC